MNFFILKLGKHATLIKSGRQTTVMSKYNENWNKFTKLVEALKEAGVLVEVSYGFNSALASVKLGCAELEVDVSDSYFQIAVACEKVQNMFKSIE